MINVDEKDIYWVAGFLEGEGSFLKCGNTVNVTAAQVQKEPLERLQKLLGGNFTTFSRKEVIGNIYHKWNAYGPLAVEIMLSVYYLMSPKRKMQIMKALSTWRLKKNGNNRGNYSANEVVDIKNRVSQLIN